MKAPQTPKHSKTRWILLGCAALAILAILCTFIAIIFEAISPTTPTPTQIALPSPTQPLTDTPSPEPTATSLPVRFVTIDGYDPASDSIIDPINVWKDYENRDAGIAAQAHHGDSVKFLRREGDGILIETADGIQGWVTYWFIEEFKEEYLATSTPPMPTPIAPPHADLAPGGAMPGRLHRPPVGLRHQGQYQCLNRGENLSHAWPEGLQQNRDLTRKGRAVVLH